MSESSKWISVAEKKPVATLGMESFPVSISDDVLVFFPGGDSQYDICNYDHEEDKWALVNQCFTEPDCDPIYWQPLPAPPEETKP